MQIDLTIQLQLSEWDDGIFFHVEKKIEIEKQDIQHTWRSGIMSQSYMLLSRR